MGFENFKIEPRKAEAKLDDYDLAKKDLEEDMAREKNEESKNVPEETAKELSEEEKIIGEEITEQLQKEGGVMQKMGDWAREQIKERTAKGKMLIAATGMFAATTIFAGNFSKAEGGQAFLGREIERAAGRVIGDIAKGAGEALGNIFRRGGTGETPREQARRIERIRHEISRQDKNYTSLQEDAVADFVKSMQAERNREGGVVTGEKRKELLRNLEISLDVIDNLHSKENHPDELCTYKQKNIKGELKKSEDILKQGERLEKK